MGYRAYCRWGRGIWEGEETWAWGRVSEVLLHDGLCGWWARGVDVFDDWFAVETD